MRIASLAVLLLGIQAVPAQAASVYWGANVGDHLTGGAVPYDMAAADRFEGMVGKRMSLMHFVQAWGDCAASPCTLRPFPRKQLETVRQAGAIPVFGWVSFSTPLTGSSQPDFQLADVLDGTYDAYIRQWARDARAWGHPFFLSLNPEMNLISTWPYVEARNGNRPGEYVRMWRHVHRIFQEEGASNVTWSWCANVEFQDSAPLAPLYPGDDQVDWTCIDGYNWWWGWRTPEQVFGPTYDKIQALAPDKPVLIGETASTERNGSKAQWITDFLGTQLPERMPNVKGVVWYEKKDPKNTNDPDGWLVESSQQSLDAFRAAIASPYFAGPAFRDLPGTKIGPLSPLVKPRPPGATDGSQGRSGGASDPSRLGAARSFSVASARRCLRRGSKVTVRYRRVKGVTVTRLRVSVGRRVLVDRRGRQARRTIVFRGLTRSSFRLTVRVTTADGRVARVIRAYRICGTARRS